MRFFIELGEYCFEKLSEVTIKSAVASFSDSINMILPDLHLRQKVLFVNISRGTMSLFGVVLICCVCHMM